MPGSSRSLSGGPRRRENCPRRDQGEDEHLEKEEPHILGNRKELRLQHDLQLKNDVGSAGKSDFVNMASDASPAPSGA